LQVDYKTLAIKIVDELCALIETVVSFFMVEMQE